MPTTKRAIVTAGYERRASIGVHGCHGTHTACMRVADIQRTRLPI
jgi:hypothetical protein